MKRPVVHILHGFLIFFVLCFCLTFIWSFLILAVLTMFLSAYARSAYMLAEQANIPPKPNTKLYFSILGGAAVFLFLTPPLELHSSQKWQYPFQRRFIGLYPNVKEPAWFPDFRKDVQRDYRFEYVPSIMQGTGHFTVHFVTSPERAAEYAVQFSAQTDETYLLAECDLDGNALYADTGFFADAPDAVIYVLESNHYFNHPHSSTVVVDTASGKVELTKYG